MVSYNKIFRLTTHFSLNILLKPAGFLVHLQGEALASDGLIFSEKMLTVEFLRGNSVFFLLFVTKTKKNHTKDLPCTARKFFRYH